MKLCMFIFAAIASGSCAPPGQEAVPCAKVSPLKALGRYLECRVDLNWSPIETLTSLRNCGQFKAQAKSISNIVATTFDVIDGNKDSTITLSEIRATFRNIHVQEDPQAEMRFNICDVNDDGSLNLEEYSLCSVQSYGIRMMKFLQPCSRRFTKRNIEDLITEFSGEIYRTVTERERNDVINGLHGRDYNNFNLVDVATVDTTLLGLFLSSLSASSS